MQIGFRQGYTTIDMSFNDNKTALERISDSLKTHYADSLYKLREITIIGAGSPEGTTAANKRVSVKRAHSLYNYLSQQGLLQDATNNYIYIGRDWQGLLQLVLNDNEVPYRDEVITLLEDIVAKTKDGESNINDNMERLVSLRDGVPYRYMFRALFPQLRKARMIFTFERLWTQPRFDAVALDAYTPLYSLSSLPQPEFEFKPIYEFTKPSKSFHMALKTNMLYDAVLIPNIGAEFYLGSQFSVAANWMYAWWRSDSQHWHWRTYGGDFAVRRWMGRRAKEKPLTGHHLGLYAQTLTYDFELGGKGYMAGEPGGNIFDKANCATGIEYGYSLPIARRLNLDFTIGAGYMWGKYYEYKPIDDCYVWQATKKRRYIGPTKAEVSLVWLIGRDNFNAKKGGKR